MKKLRRMVAANFLLLSAALVGAGLAPVSAQATAVSPDYFAAVHHCGGGGFLGFPTWYSYLPGKNDSNGLCSPQIDSINDFWLVVAAAIEIMLRVASIAAVVFVIYGGVKYTTSQGEPEKTNQARSTIVNALVGLLISVMAAAIVSFIAGSIS